MVTGTLEVVPLLLLCPVTSLNLWTLEVCWESSAPPAVTLLVQRSRMASLQVKYYGSRQPAYSFKLFLICFYKLT